MSYGFSQTGLGTIKGVVTDSESNEPIEGSKIKISLNGTVKGGAYSDEDGKFQINSITPGAYNV